MTEEQINQMLEDADLDQMFYDIKDLEGVVFENGPPTMVEEEAHVLASAIVVILYLHSRGWINTKAGRL